MKTKKLAYKTAYNAVHGDKDAQRYENFSTLEKFSVQSVIKKRRVFSVF